MGQIALHSPRSGLKPPIWARYEPKSGPCPTTDPPSERGPIKALRGRNSHDMVQKGPNQTQRFPMWTTYEPKSGPRPLQRGPKRPEMGQIGLKSP